MIEKYVGITVIKFSFRVHEAVDVRSTTSNNFKSRRFRVSSNHRYMQDLSHTEHKVYFNFTGNMFQLGSEPSSSDLYLITLIQKI